MLTIVDMGVLVSIRIASGSEPTYFLFYDLPSLHACWIPLLPHFRFLVDRRFERLVDPFARNSMTQHRSRDSY